VIFGHFSSVQNYAPFFAMIAAQKIPDGGLFGQLLMFFGNFCQSLVFFVFWDHFGYLGILGVAIFAKLWQLFCKDCSTKKAQMEGFKNPQCVCNHCYAEIQQTK
jgi:hypothetical protein